MIVEVSMLPQPIDLHQNHSNDSIILFQDLSTPALPAHLRTSSQAPLFLQSPDLILPVTALLLLFALGLVHRKQRKNSI
jgi:hypothetical protein